MALVGYARVSSIGQSLDVQLEKLKHCDKIFSEKRSSVDGERPALRECLSYLREGDVFIFTRIDRLARSVSHLSAVLDDLGRRGVTVRAVDQGIDTSTPEGRAMINMLATFAQFETELRKERQAEGIAKAKERGVRFGRQSKLTPEVGRRIQELRETGSMIREIMAETGLSKATVYRALSAPERP
ncbi:recombinase family protein [Roseibium aggregatum]|uniref:DNA-invertase hin n=1 Tax=Roseibium aggregatum TaxID=187304 RepID=A0A0M6YEL1_9HYPH|nr:recombinase family protein [Roseibium aggregatum]CTQ47697.1 DNA-invertase hin [Roseibium aggregatum]